MKQGKMSKTNRVATNGFSPMAQGSSFPLLILRNHAPSQFSCSEHSWLGYLIKMHIYMMSQFNICRMSQYTIDDHSNLKHNTTKLMVGLFPLAPHHDYLQYMYHVYLMQTGSKSGCYIPLPCNSTVLGALQNLKKMLHWYHLNVP